MSAERWSTAGAAVLGLAAALVLSLRAANRWLSVPGISAFGQ